MVPHTYKRSKTTDFFYKICLFVYIVGFPNYWFENLKLSKRFTRIYNRINVINNTLLTLLLFLEVAAFYTQDNMKENQRLLLVVHIIAIFTYGFYFSWCIYHKETIRSVLSNLAVISKAIYNDPVVEKQMIKNNLMYFITFALIGSSTMIMIDAAGLVDTVRNNVPYTAIVTVYPDMYDNSTPANTARVFIFIIQWVYISRAFGVHILLPSLALSLSYQYRNLSSYFSSLSEIFERQDLSQEEKEELYENNFKTGIKMHVDTLGCTRQTNTVCNGVFSGQFISNILLLALLMVRIMQSDRSLGILLSSLTTAISVLFTAGLFMWNAGDVTVEASHLPTAIYFSGWHNCRGQIRIRKLVSITLAFAQRPIILKGLGYIELSYQCYLTIVKTAYSVFSVLY